MITFGLYSPQFTWKYDQNWVGIGFEHYSNHSPIRRIWSLFGPMHRSSWSKIKLGNVGVCLIDCSPCLVSLILFTRIKVVSLTMNWYIAWKVSWNSLKLIEHNNRSILAILAMFVKNKQICQEHTNCGDLCAILVVQKNIFDGISMISRHFS